MRLRNWRRSSRSSKKLRHVVKVRASWWALLRALAVRWSHDWHATVCLPTRKCASCVSYGLLGFDSFGYWYIVLKLTLASARPSRDHATSKGD